MVGEVKPIAHSRDPVIDISRGIAILLVVLGHNSAISHWSPAFVATIFLFHVPLFFLLSGYVFKPGEPRRVAGKLARRLLVPCFAAALLVGVTKTVVREESFGRLFAGIAWGTGQTLPWSHLWFLPTLFLCLLLLQTVSRQFQLTPVRWIVGASIVAFFILPVESGGTVASYSFAYPVGLPWGIDLLALCMVFVFIGYLLQIRPSFAGFVRRPLVGSMALPIFAWAAMAATSDLNLRIFQPFLPALLAALCGCVLAIQAAVLMNRSAILAWIFSTLGRHTMPIFLLHVSIQKALLHLDVPPLVYQAWLAGLITTVAAVIVSIAIERCVMVRVGLLRYLFLAERAT